MKSDVNREGLTFEEWVCAAGVAKFDQGLVLAYTESRTVIVGPDEWDGWADTRRRVVKRTVWYPLEIRKAWRDGEDPTEYRA